MTHIAQLENQFVREPKNFYLCAMKNIEELNQSKVPVVQIDKTLEIYREKILFKDKLDQANETLKKVGLPNFLILPKKAN
jgi:hypothetical protein